jgi:hypothetical protein
MWNVHCSSAKNGVKVAVRVVRGKLTAYGMDLRSTLFATARYDVA